MTWLDAKLHRDEHGRIIDPPVVIPTRTTRERTAYRGGRPRLRAFLRIGDEFNGRVVTGYLEPGQDNKQVVMARCTYCGKEQRVRHDNLRKAPCRCGGYQR